MKLKSIKTISLMSLIFCALGLSACEDYITNVSNPAAPSVDPGNTQTNTQAPATQNPVEVQSPVPGVGGKEESNAPRAANEEEAKSEEMPPVGNDSKENLNEFEVMSGYYGKKGF